MSLNDRNDRGRCFVAGNVSEWADYYNSDDKPSPATACAEYTAVSGSTSLAKTSLVPSSTQKTWWTNTWNGASNGIRQYYAGAANAGGALRRGGAWNHNRNAGVCSRRT